MTWADRLLLTVININKAALVRLLYRYHVWSSQADREMSRFLDGEASLAVRWAVSQLCQLLVSSLCSCK